MTKLHVTQDDAGFWQLTLEQQDGTLTLLAHQFVTQAHLVQDAHELVNTGEYPGAVVVVDPPRAALSGATTAWPDSYRKPAPRKAGE